MAILLECVNGLVYLPDAPRWNATLCFFGAGLFVGCASEGDLILLYIFQSTPTKISQHAISTSTIISYDINACTTGTCLVLVVGLWTF